MGLIAIDNTNFENGVTNRNARELFGSYREPDPTRYHRYFEDFDYYVAANFTITGAGAGTQALADIDGGVLRLTTAGADNDAELLVKNGQGLTFEASKPIYYRARLQTNDAVESDLFTGLADAAPFTPGNGVFFRKDDGDALLDVVVRSGAAEVASALGVATITAAFFTAEFFWDGISRIYYGVNRTPLGFLTVNTAAVALPVGELSPVFGVQAGSAAARQGDWDYILASKLRD